MATPRLFVPGLTADERGITLPADEAHHVTRVLRLGVGGKVRVFDGRGREWEARLTSTGKRSETIVELDREIEPVPEPAVRLTLAAGILKGDHMDAVVRDATMMGAAEIVPLVSAHVTVPPKAWKSGGAEERWRRVAVASAKQCGRAVVPGVAAPMDLSATLARHKTEATLMFVEPAPAAAAVHVHALSGQRPKAVLALIGPEGGWSAEEIEQARALGATLLHLGPRTIRADAMATAALSALWAIWY